MEAWQWGPEEVIDEFHLFMREQYEEYQEKKCTCTDEDSCGCMDFEEFEDKFNRRFNYDNCTY